MSAVERMARALYEAEIGAKPPLDVSRWDASRGWRNRAERVLAAFPQHDGAAAVLDVRMTALADAIRGRDWEQVEFQYDRVQSALGRMLETRDREVDRVRREVSS